MEDAIYDWIVAATGVSAHWDFQKIPQPEFPFASMRILSIARLNGEDETRIEEDPGSPPGEEIEQIRSGPRRMTVSVNFYSTSNDALSDAMSLASTAQASLALPSIAALLYGAGLAVIGEGSLQDLSALEAETWVSRSQFDVVFGIASNTSEKSGYIETVEVDAPAIGWNPETFTLDS
jgi:hypothetical protein